jgi:Fe-S cluster assembly protein SufD
VKAIFEDKWIHQTTKNINVSNSNQGIPRQRALKIMKSLRFPLNNIEEFRFFEIDKLSKTQLMMPQIVKPTDLTSHIARLCSTREGHIAVIVDGIFSPELSSLANLPTGVHIDSLAEMRELQDLNAALHFDDLSSSSGGFFACLNSATMRDSTGVIVLPGSILDAEPIHLLMVGSCTHPNSAFMTISTPRVFIFAGCNSTLKITEEYISFGIGQQVTNSVTELHLSKDAKVSYGYIQLESSCPKSYHLKTTIINQEKNSHLEFTEVRLGSDFSRHELHVNQLESRTVTNMKHFILAHNRQLHDLHSKIKFDHQNGLSNQLHKCIVSHSTGRSTFDGNVKVNQLAQKTDAQQLSRSLLLSPKATVNIKPNLQIIADDVKCTHGCTISDLDDLELFYFASRGIEKQAARQAIVRSFGREVTNQVVDKNLREQIEDVILFKITLF